MDPRRNQLNAWRKSKGRTPMKRMSLVQECHKATPKIHHSNTSTVRSVSRQTKRGGGGGSERKDGQRVVQSSRGIATPHTHTSDQKLTRREKLGQWLAVHGSTVKRPRSVLQPLNRVLARTDVKPTRPFTSVQRGFPHSASALRRLKEQLQREIDEDCQDIELLECVEDDVAQQLNYSRDMDCTNSILTPTTSHKVRTRRSLAADPSLIFPSSTIRYSLSQSEPRRKHKRRHTMSSTFCEKRTIYLTPVRRSTRESRGPYTGDECIDSPSQLTNCDITVEIMPNKALEFDD